MIRKMTSASLIAAGITLSIAAFANTMPRRQQCENYASQAVEDYRTTTKYEKCRVKRSGRWQDNYEAHYNWCMKAPEAAILAEWKARTDHLKRCGEYHTM